VFAINISEFEHDFLLPSSSNDRIRSVTIEQDYSTSQGQGVSVAPNPVYSLIFGYIY